MDKDVDDDDDDDDDDGRNVDDLIDDDDDDDGDLDDIFEKGRGMYVDYRFVCLCMFLFKVVGCYKQLGWTKNVDLGLEL